MKITLEIPEDVFAMTVVIIRGYADKPIRLGATSYANKELYDGAVIKLIPREVDNG